MNAAAAYRALYEGRHVLVTGASSGIGLSVALGLAKAGARLSVLAENDLIHEAAAEIAATGTAPEHVLQCDVSDAGQVRAALDPLPPIDALIQVAGYQPRTPVDNPDPLIDAEFERCMAINVTGMWHVTRAALGKMGQGGKIVLTSSIWGKTAVPEYAGYVTSKHAVIGLTRALAADLGPKGINVNAVCPGWVETEGAMWTVREQAAEQGIPAAEIVQQIADSFPMPGMMQPRDMQAIYLFLASDLARDMTGQAINVDRGAGVI